MIQATERHPLLHPIATLWRRLDERRRYRSLLTRLERINADDVGTTQLPASAAANQVFGGRR